MTKITEATDAASLSLAGWKLPAARPSNTSPYFVTMEEIAAFVLSGANIANINLSGLPTSDPGGGKLWLNGGVLQVGP